MARSVCVVLGLAGCIAVAGCSADRSTPNVPDPAAVRVVRSAERAMGGSDALGEIFSISARAGCSGPNGEFSLRIDSRLPDAARFTQRYPDRPVFDALVIGREGWRFTPSGSMTLDEATRAMIRGHELHAMLLRLLDRFPGLERGPEVDFEGRPCLSLIGRDVTGRSATVFVDGDDALPAGFRLEDPLGPRGQLVTIDLGDWRTVGDVQLPHRAAFTSRGEVWRYTFVELLINSVEAGLFEAPSTASS